MIESVCQPLLLQKLISILTEVQGLATSTRLFVIVNDRMLNNRVLVNNRMLTNSIKLNKLFLL